MISKMDVRRDLQALSLGDMDSSCNAPRPTEVPRPKHALSKGFMTSAEDERPEANLLIGSSQYALQSHKHVIICIGRVSVGRRLKSLNALLNSHIKGEAFNYLEVLSIAIHTV